MVGMKGIQMTCLRVFLVLAVLAAFMPVAHSQDDSFLIKDIGKHQRPLVLFNHKLHAKRFDCSRCHHDYDANLNNRSPEGQPCDSCHQAKAQGAMPSLKDAFHRECLGCHKTMKAGPVSCGACHIRKAG